MPFDFTNTPPSPSYAIHKEQTTPSDSRFTVYPIASLNQLISEEENIQDKACPNRYRVRYILDAQGHLWFAKTGRANKHTPWHYQMTEKAATQAFCVAAGYIEFDKDLKAITHVTLENYDYSFQPQDIQWVLAVLLNNKDKLPVQLLDPISIERSYSYNEAARILIDVPHSDIQAWLDTTHPLTKSFASTKQPTETRPITIHQESLRKRIREVGELPLNTTYRGPTASFLFYPPTDELLEAPAASPPLRLPDSLA